MKKLLSLLLVTVMIFSFAACSGDDGASSADAGSNSESSKSDIDVPEVPEVSEVTSAPESLPDSESSGVPSDENTLPEFISNYISYGEINTKVLATSSNSVRLTGVDVDAGYGDVVLYTYKTSGNISGLDEFAVAVFEYDTDLLGYVKTSFSDVGEISSARVPDDGFLVVAHTAREGIVASLKAIPADQTVFPNGVQPCGKIAYTAKKAAGGINIDGIIGTGEWTDYRIEDVNAENTSWNYLKFEKGNYYSTATYYAAYDDEYLYLCVVVDSPYHYCPISQSNASDMWKYECIQVKVSSASPDSDYILEHYDHVIDPTASNEGVVRAYGFAVNDDGDTCYYENSVIKEFGGLAACNRDDGTQATVYEVAITWEEFGITPEAGMKIGLTFSINSTNADDAANGVWKNITYRNGGGVIGRNDWSKIPVVTLG